MLERRQRGDTLIEVLFAFTILSLVIVGAMTIMNQGTLASQRSLETTLVRDQIDAQATTLRFLHDAYVAGYRTNGTYDAATPAGQWQAMVAGITATTASPFDTGTRVCPAAPSGSFILNSAQAKYIKSDTGALSPAQTFAQVTYDDSTGALLASQGIWIEAIRSQITGDATADDNARFIDFHIRACWENPGQGPVMTIGTIVRLYEPRG